MINQTESRGITSIIIENLTDGLLFFNEENKVSLINPAACRVFQVDKNDILGKKIDDFSNFEKLSNLFYLLGREIKEYFKKELEINRDLILEVTSIPVKEKGDKIGSLVILHNVTREKMIEKMKTEFVSISAHQLRTPLSEINWSLEVLGSEKIGKLTEGQKEVLKKAHHSNKRILNLVDDLLNVVKIEEGRRVYDLVSTDFENIVQSVIKLYQEKIRSKQIKFEFQVPNKKLPKVNVDAKKIFLVIQNLLENAISYNVVGGMITISLENKGKEIEFSIADSGIGIPENEHKNVFQKFFRAENALKKETDGNGLGLFIVKNIIEAHNGKVWFESVKDRGSTFYFSLPVK